jgi:hypothetical protein
LRLYGQFEKGLGLALERCGIEHRENIAEVIVRRRAASGHRMDGGDGKRTIVSFTAMCRTSSLWRLQRRLS